MLAGTARTVGSEVLLTAEVLASGDGAVLGSASKTTTAGSAGIPAAVERLALAVREQLGETLDRLGTEGEHRELATTSSLRALRLYQEAEAVIARYGMDATSEEFLREAIQEDPGFASAHVLLAYALHNQGRTKEEVMEHAEKALELAEANYHALLRLHPDHYWGNNNLSLILGPTPGIPLRVRKARYRPNDLDANWDAAYALAIVGGRPEEARPYAERVVELTPGTRSSASAPRHPAPARITTRSPRSSTSTAAAGA